MSKRYPVLTSRGEIQAITHSGEGRWIQGTVGGNPVLTRPGDTTTYTSGDEISNNVLAGSALPWVFPDVAEEEGGRAFVRWCLITSSQNISFTPMIWLFNAAPTMCGDNSPFSHILADEDKLIIANQSSLQSIAGVGSRSVSLCLQSSTMKCADGTKDIYGVLVSGSYVPLSNQTFRIKMLVEY